MRRTNLLLLLVTSAGLNADTDIVEDILPGSFGSAPNGMDRLGGVLIFGADDGSGDEPWVSDGTVAGTRRLKDISPLAGYRYFYKHSLGFDVVLSTEELAAGRRPEPPVGTQHAA